MVAGDPANADSGPLDSVSPSTPAQITGIASLAELNPVADTWVDEDHPSTNYGGVNNLVAGNGDYQWALLKFDLSSLPDYFDVCRRPRSVCTPASTYRTAVGLPAAPLANDLKADAITDEWTEMTVDCGERPATVGASAGPAHLLQL